MQQGQWWVVGFLLQGGGRTRRFLPLLGDRSEQSVNLSGMARDYPRLSEYTTLVLRYPSEQRSTPPPPPRLLFNPLQSTSPSCGAIVVGGARKAAVQRES